MLLKNHAKLLLVTSCLAVLHSHIIFAQQATAVPDTMRLSFQQTEKLFLDSNLQLLAQHYNIQSNEALVEQARKWENPVLNTDQNVYSNKKFFEHGKNTDGSPAGQFYVQIQQLIKTAGKRGKQIDLAKTNVRLAEWQFNTALRELRATLYTDFYTLAQLNGNASLFNDNLTRLNKLLHAMEQEFSAGNIAKKEYLRVQALIISLKQDINSNDKAIEDAESELKTMLQIAGNVVIMPLVPEAEKPEMPQVPFAFILDSARKNNTDYNMEKNQVLYNQQNLRLQKALAIPDVTVGPEFDQASNYTPNYYGLAISLPLPVWDRNQGNIKSARFQLKQEETNLKLAEKKLQNDVMNAYKKLQLSVQLSENSNKSFYTDYYQLYQNIVESYNKRQISMIEFLDYFNDYQEVRKNQLQQILDLRLAKESLNDIVGANIAE